MKKLLALMLALAFCLSLTCAFAEDDNLSAAKEYLFTMYRKKPETTPADYTVVGGVNIGGVIYDIEWTADSDTIQVVPGEDKMVTIDVDEKNPEELHYVLTATIKDAEGNAVSVSFNHKVPAALILDGLSYEEIVEAAYTLEDGLAMDEAQRLFGKIVKIDTPWSDEYKNITVTMQIGELADKTVQCYRLSGEGAEALKEGDEITVEGILKNYKGTIEFDKGCKLIGLGEHVSQAAILKAAYAVEDGAEMANPTALAGKIVKIDSPWSDEYKNISVIIVCDGQEDKPILCYRLSGEGAEALKEGDEIGVVGTIKNYKGTIEFDKGCKLIPAASAADARTLLAAYTLEDGLAMNKPCKLTGVITKIDSPWSDKYGNITVIMEVAGQTELPIMAYRLSGEGAKDLAEGDTITVEGTIKNYKGTIEFDKGCQLLAVVK